MMAKPRIPAPLPSLRPLPPHKSIFVEHSLLIPVSLEYFPPERGEVECRWWVRLWLGDGVGGSVLRAC
jgi:hypothetical protein